MATKGTKPTIDEFAQALNGALDRVIELLADMDDDLLAIYPIDQIREIANPKLEVIKSRLRSAAAKHARKSKTENDTARYDLLRNEFLARGGPEKISATDFAREVSLREAKQAAARGAFDAEVAKIIMSEGHSAADGTPQRAKARLLAKLVSCMSADNLRKVSEQLSTRKLNEFRRRTRRP